MRAVVPAFLRFISLSVGTPKASPFYFFFFPELFPGGFNSLLYVIYHESRCTETLGISTGCPYECSASDWIGVFTISSDLTRALVHFTTLLWSVPGSERFVFSVANRHVVWSSFH